MGLWDVVTTVTDFGSILGDTVLSLVMMLLYPIYVFSDIILGVFHNFYNMISVMVGMFVSVIDFLNNTVFWLITALFPSAASVLLIATCMLVIALALIKKIGGIWFG